MATDITILNRAGVEKAKLSYIPDETVRDLKKRILAKSIFSL